MSAQDDVTLQAGSPPQARDWARSRTVTWQPQPGRADAAAQPAATPVAPAATAANATPAKGRRLLR
ncbi:MAG: hypothetical protein GAK41_00562 [Burkholderia gladioli]|nr:MAG: hypothetical protein GAK41_00562 [Burkholderia gladioli]